MYVKDISVNAAVEEFEMLQCSGGVICAQVLFGICKEVKKKKNGGGIHYSYMGDLDLHCV